MARKRSKDKLGMTCYPPAEVAATLGAFKTTELTQAIRIAAQILGRAAGEVSGMFDAAEWTRLAALLESRSVEPEFPNPGPLLGDLAQQASERYGLGGEAKPAKVESVADRLRRLSYAQAWAVLIALGFRRDNADRLDDGARWWDVATRWRLLTEEQE